MKILIKINIIIIFYCMTIFSTILELKIDTVDVFIQNPVYTKKTVSVRVYWYMYNNSEIEITNISSPWSGLLQNPKFGTTENKKTCGNSNLILVSSGDTLFPYDWGPIPPSTPYPCIETYKRLNIAPADTVTGQYSNFYYYNKFRRIMNNASETYLILLYDSRYEQDDVNHNLKEKRRISKALAYFNDIELSDYDHKRDIYKKYYKVKPLKINSEKYLLTKQWWEKVDRSITYYTCIYQILDSSRQRENLSDLVSVVSIGELGYDDLVPYLITEIDADTSFDLLSNFALESLVKLNSYRAIPYLIDCYLSSENNKYIMNGNYYIRKEFNEIEEYNQHLACRFNIEELRKAFLSEEKVDQNDSLRIREKGIIYLKKLTGKTFGYDPYGPKEERDKAIKRWKEWWEDNKQKYLKDDENKTGSKIDIFKERMKY